LKTSAIPRRSTPRSAPARVHARAPSRSFTIGIRRTIVATNVGGEVHTFTRVAQFGGGIVPALNTASNNPVEAPECAALAASDMLSPGASFTTLPAAASGTHLYQCCIHPWMRSTVTVVP
jgi:plastocyanin